MNDKFSKQYKIDKNIITNLEKIYTINHQLKIIKLKSSTEPPAEINVKSNKPLKSILSNSRSKSTYYTRWNKTPKSRGGEREGGFLDLQNISSPIYNQTANVSFRPRSG